MRSVSIFALMACGTVLAGCAGSGSGSGTLAAGLDVCGITCNPTGGGGSGGGNTPDPNDLDGDGTPDGDSDDDGNTGSGAGGNPTDLDTGATAITLEGGKQKTPTSGKSLLRLTSATNTTHNATVAGILSNNKPTTMKAEFDTKTDTNSQWAVPIQMSEYKPGTKDMGWYDRSHYDTTAVVRNSVGAIVAVYDPNLIRSINSQVVTGGFARANASGVSTGVSAANLFTNPFYAAQIMDERANGGTGTNYREYRVYSDELNRDEVLQVWAWNDSYAVQYRNAISGGGPAKQQAWAFGGNATTTMPTAGSATYNGRFVANAKTENWVNPDGSDINPNNIWMVEGSSQVRANFGNGRVTGTLAPETWTSFQNGAFYTWRNATAENPSTAETNPLAVAPANPTDVIYSDVAEPDFGFYSENVTLAGTITGNTYSGNAAFGEEYLMGDNVMEGGIYGSGASETAGVFALDGTSPDPYGGSTGIEDDRRGFLKMNGAFHGER